jgi:hypothetical protein
MKRHQPAPAKRQPLTEKRIREIIQEELAKLALQPIRTNPASPRIPGAVYVYGAPLRVDPFPPAVAYYACSFVPEEGVSPPTASIIWTSTGSINIGKKP